MFEGIKTVVSFIQQLLEEFKDTKGVVRIRRTEKMIMLEEFKDTKGVVRIRISVEQGK